jgi:2'-5' RNA ligase
MIEGELYFIAVMPPAEIREEITEIKEYFRDMFRAKHALKSPPHITLIPPFKWPSHKEKNLIESLDDFSMKIKNFKVSLAGFGSFPPRVIYINIRENQNLNSLFKKLVSEIDPEIKMQMKNLSRFNPHMTLATRDLSRNSYREAWSIFNNRTFRKDFVIDKLVLLKHNGRKWEIFHESRIGNN